MKPFVFLILISISLDFSFSFLSLYRVLTISRHLFRSFVLHASILKPLSEDGKLRLTNDMTELEFSLSQLLAEGGNGLTIKDCGDEGKDFRAFK